jgi:hypothetical protein
VEELLQMMKVMKDRKMMKVMKDRGMKMTITQNPATQKIEK